MACSEEATKYEDAIDELVNAFNGIVPYDTLFRIVESCCGDLNNAANLLITVINEDKLEAPAQTTSNSRKKNTKASKRSKQKDIFIPYFPTIPEHKFFTTQIKQIMKYYHRGTRVLVIMRGAPGSGKSYLATQIQNMTVGNNPKQRHLYSTDDYFYQNGFYSYSAQNLNKAHLWNQGKADYAMVRGYSPVIIDNTNVYQWEIKPYVISGVCNGYYLEVVEPNTSWSKDLLGLIARNRHKVPETTIQRMLKGLEIPITPKTLMKNFNLSYPQEMKPPVRRNIPEVLNFSYENSTSGQTVVPSQPEEDKNKDTNAEFITGNNIYYKSKYFNEKINCTMAKEECSSSKVTLNVEIPQVNANDALKYNKVENECSNVKVEALNISDDDLILQSGMIDKSESNQASIAGNNLQINCDVEKNNMCAAVQNVLQTSDSTHVDTEVSLKEASHESNCKKIEGSQETLKILEEYQNLEKEWDNGDAWEEDSNRKKEQVNSSIDEILPKERRIKDLASENSLQISDDGSDWRNMYKPMSSFTDNMSQITLSSVLSKDMVEMKTVSTCVQMGDEDTSNIKNGSKVISTRARDININYVPNSPERIPKNRKFDKSSMTNDVTILGGIHRCRNENKHFIRFRNMFKHLKTEWLRDIFDNCCGDVNWAVSIIMDDMPNNKNACIMLDDKSEIEEEDFDESCDCASFYGIIPDVAPTDVNGEHNTGLGLTTLNSTDISNPVKKQKKNSVLSDSSLALKRQIEQNIVISDEHYSEECLKLRKMRRGVLDGDVSTSQNIATGIAMQNTKQLDTCSVLSENADEDNRDIIAPSRAETVDSECNSDEEFMFGEVEKTVDVNVGHEFVRKLDELFGRGDMDYSEKIEPKIRVPISLLNQLNSLWMESLMYQLETETKSHEEMMKQDEAFARALAFEQLHITESGKVQDVPNLKDIMDMELALSVYCKECDAITQKELPMDLAARLSRKKLYDLFPEIPPKDLDCLLVAYKNDFQVTVSVILENQGRQEILQQENGINKFIMAQEVERQNKFLIAEKERLAEENEMNLLEAVDINTLNYYINEASLHNDAWKKNMANGNRFIKDNTEVANYYKSIAELHLMQYERAKSAAIIISIQLQSKTFEYISHLDLHFFRVVEAKFVVNIYIDTQIKRLRMLNWGPKKYVPLFIITGRGLHSRYGPKIKPAVLKIIRLRKLNYNLENPGLVMVKVTAVDRLSYEWPSTSK